MSRDKPETEFLNLASSELCCKKIQIQIVDHRKAIVEIRERGSTPFRPFVLNQEFLWCCGETSEALTISGTWDWLEARLSAILGALWNIAEAVARLRPGIFCEMRDPNFAGQRGTVRL